jgi:ABC-type nitrate/sulfonate/bicarbonate transport system permease component
LIEATLRRQEIWAQIIANAAVVVFIAGWWYAARGLPAFVLPGPLDVARELTGFLYERDLQVHLATSFFRVVASALLALVLAVALALPTRNSPVAGAILQRRVLLFFGSFPAIGWAILGVIWFQVSSLTVIFIQVAIILPFCLNNVIEGMRNIDHEIEELGFSLTDNRWRRFTRITMPLMAPFLVAGLRVSYGICWKIALVAELFGVQKGLGYLLMQAQSTANASLVFACCILIVLIFTVTDRFLLVPLEARFSRNRLAS